MMLKQLGRLPKRLVPTAALAATLLLSSCSAMANDDVWRCAVPNGAFDQNPIPIPAGTKRVTGEIIFNKAEFGERFLPRARVGFMDSKQEDAGCQCNGFIAMVFPDQPENVTIYFVADGRDLPVWHVPYDKPVTFDLSFDDQNVMTLRMGTGVHHSTPIHPERDSLMLACTSADVTFRNVQIQ